MKNKYRFLLSSVAFTTLSLLLIPAANAAQWMAYYNASSCRTGPGFYQGPSSGQDGPYASEAECETAISNARSSYSLPVCAITRCTQTGSGDSGNTASGQITRGATSSGVDTSVQQTGAIAFGLVLGALILDAQSNARAKAEQARREARLRAELKRQRAARDRRNEQIKQHLLGQSKSNDPSDLSLMGVTDEPQLQLMTGDQALAPLASNSQSVNHQSPLNTKHTKSKAFNQGFHDAAQCVSQNAGPYCANLSGKPWQTCLDDYRAGFDVGNKKQQQKLIEARLAGRHDQQIGKKANAMFDPRAAGGCHTEWVKAYQDGYFRSTHDGK
jgi:hypothetical protein